MTAPPFALSPSLSTVDPIDYSTPQGAKIFETAVKELQQDDKFDVTSEGLMPFLTKFKARVNTCGRKDILLIPEDAENPDVNLTDLLENYGEISMDQVQAHARTYID